MLEKYKSCRLCDLASPNYMRLPVNILTTAEEYNKIVEWCRNNKKMTEGITRTYSGGICLKNKKLNIWESAPRYSAKKQCTGAEITILYCDVNEKTGDVEYFGGRFQLGVFSGVEEHEKKLFGRQAYIKFKELLEKRNIKIEDYFISEEKGKEEKSKIERPMICLGFGAHANEIYEHCYHIDRNASYASGLKEKIPEWGPVIDYLYEHRKEKKIYKQVLNEAIGFFQSKFIHYQLAHLSRYSIKRNNEELSKMAIELIKKDCHILLFNTDGFWFTKPEGLEIETSKKLGDFKIDHLDCKLRIKSPGVYEYIEDGKYYPVVRGRTMYDLEKTRDEWEWGDIYKPGSRIKIYKFHKEDGTVEDDYLDNVMF